LSVGVPHHAQAAGAVEAPDIHVAPAAASPGILGSVFSSLRHRNYRLLWLASFSMGAGQWIQQVTLGWLLYDLSGSPVLLGALNGLRAAPFLISGPIAGVVADRMDRRRLLLIYAPILVIATALMGVLVSAGLAEVWHVFLFTMVTATVFSCNQPVKQAMIPSVVPRHDLMNAITLNSMAMNSTKMVGPALGGLLIAIFGAGGNFFVQSLAYAVVVWLTFQIVVPVSDTVRRARKTSALADLKEGLRYVAKTPAVLAIMAAALIPHMFSFPYQVLMPVFQKDVLNLGPEALGLLMAAPGVGAVLALITLAATAHRWKRSGSLLMAGLIALGICLILFSRTTSLPVAMLALTGVGACQMVFMNSTNAMLQSIVPDELRGRVMSIYMLDRGLSPMGALLAGVGAHFIGAPLTVTIMGSIVLLLALVVAWRVPQLRSLETA
jgi:MFS family permease